MITPHEIDYQVNYACPYCGWYNWIAKNVLENPNFKTVFCECGKNFDIKKINIQYDTPAVKDTHIEKPIADTEGIVTYKDLLLSLEKKKIKYEIEPPPKPNKIQITDFDREAVELLKEQEYTNEDIRGIMKIVKERGITTIEEIFKTVIPDYVTPY